VPAKQTSLDNPFPRPLLNHNQIKFSVPIAPAASTFVSIPRQS
jgi:hypothetical protein